MKIVHETSEHERREMVVGMAALLHSYVFECDSGCDNIMETESENFREFLGERYVAGVHERARRGVVEILKSLRMSEEEWDLIGVGTHATIASNYPIASAEEMGGEYEEEYYRSKQYERCDEKEEYEADTDIIQKPKRIKIS